jgi:hypothetical protein
MLTNDHLKKKKNYKEKEKREREKKKVGNFSQIKNEDFFLMKQIGIPEKEISERFRF